MLEEEQKNELKKQVVEGKAGLRAVEGILKAQKENRKIKDEEKSFETTQKSYDKLVNLIEKVGVSGAITSQFGGEDAEAYAEFTSLTGAIESLLVEKVNRGTLSNTRFNYITKDLLPKPNDSQATIRGKLRGLATILNLDSSKLTGENNTESPTKQSEKRPSLSSFERK